MQISIPPAMPPARGGTEQRGEIKDMQLDVESMHVPVRACIQARVAVCVRHTGLDVSVRGEMSCSCGPPRSDWRARLRVM